MGLNPFVKKEKIKAYFFTPQHQYEYGEYELKQEENRMIFEKDKGFYVVDKSASRYFTKDGQAIYYYLKGIPNPLTFDFTHWLNKYLEFKRKNPEGTLYDYNKMVVDVSFSSDALRQYKDWNFLKKLMSKMTPEQAKIMMALIGLCALSWIVTLVGLFIRR